MTPGFPYAEVIGDPVAQSKSPLIHKHWLAQLKMDGDYARTRVAERELGDFLEKRRADRQWRGCNVTIPHKENIVGLLDVLEDRARSIGAVNIVVPGEAGLVGHNSDVDGAAAALDEVDVEGQAAVMIGAGGAARAACVYLGSRKLGRLLLIARSPIRAEALRGLLPGTEISIVSLSDAHLHLAPAALVINASPLGMAAKPQMPRALLEALSRRASGATFFDMVYDPLETPFLEAARSGGARIVDGLAMLIGQAGRSFELFFGAQPPPGDRALRDLLVT